VGLEKNSMFSIAPKRGSAFLILFLGWSWGGCASSSFSGKTGNKKADPAGGQSSDGTTENSKDGEGGNGSPSSGSKECDPVHGKTIASVMTKQVANGQKGNYIEFSLSLSTCENQSKTFSGDLIYFDLDALTSLAGLGQKLPFTLKAAAESQKGTFEEIQGEDLFGKKGPKRYHYRTEREITLQTAVSSVTMRIELLGMRVQGEQNAGNPTGNGSSMQIPIYMRFGKASPVKAEITFEGNPS
jgi:hypothetical protein